MEHPGAGAAEDGIAELFDGAGRDEPRQRASRQVLALVLGWVVVIAIAAAVLVLAAPTIQTVVVAIVGSVIGAGRS